MINIIKSQIRPLKLSSQNDNQASMHREGTVNVLGVAGRLCLLKQSFPYYDSQQID